MASLTQWEGAEQAPGVDDGLGSLVCCSQWGCKELDMTLVTVVVVTTITTSAVGWLCDCSQSAVDAHGFLK